MTLPVVLTAEAEAEAEFDAAADWYEQQAGLGLEFTVQVRKVLTEVGQMPNLCHGLSGRGPLFR
ncbi:MAG: hypothetical protein NVSMB9_31990 [Isosphaeraceae bacterium]